ncbi:ABI3 protein, partial [Atrichornis clamosus]|nr:ABI3 protein [Atrichornis clamosus]
ELERLQQRDIPEGRRLLRDQHGNLHRVADYCESNYLQAGDKRKALEETMALSTQSLASVTYQVSSLATAFLRLLDLQAARLRRVEADVACVAQRVDIHKEKVSRREIGSLTVTRRVPSPQKIVAPPSPPCLEPYYRRPLNFSVLDDIGHGMKDTSTQLARTGTLARKGTKASAQAGATLGRSSRVPEPIQPPVVPEGKLSTASSSSSPVSLRCWEGPGHPSPVLLLPRGSTPGAGVPAPPPPPGPPPAPAAAVPPPPPLPGHLLPPPAGHLAAPPADLMPPAPDDLEPLPPPPAVPDFEDLALPPPPAAEEPPWAPENYLEKVVALYPYVRQKDNELSLQPGALLFVTRRYSDGWCEGVLGEDSGFFPGNFVEPL